VTPASVRVRRTTDLAAVRSLGVASGLEDSERGDEDVLAAWGAFAGGALVGAIALERLGELDTVNWLAVAEGCRGRGIAGRLYAALEREALARGMGRLWVTARAPGFFRAQGFGPVPPGAEHDILLGDCPACPQYERGCAPRALVKDLGGEEESDGSP
jgi:N-acetylglutamate synthase-like GNAT family acetyltransferase